MSANTVGYLLEINKHQVTFYVSSTSFHFIEFIQIEEHMLS